MNTTKSLLLVSLFAAANVAFAAQPVNTGSPLTTTASDLHNVQADYATVQRAHGVPTPTVRAQLVEAPATVRIENSLSPTTTSQAALHNVKANQQATAEAHQLRVERLAARSYAAR
jgi:hypothetical protein